MVNSATVEVHYDSAMLRPRGCTADPEGLYELAECNANYGDGAVRLAAISQDGVDSSSQLATIQFEVIGDLNADTQLDMHVVDISGVDGVTLPVIAENSLDISQVAWETYLPVILK